jgi:lysophospholipase L1-like esterase
VKFLPILAAAILGALPAAARFVPASDPAFSFQGRIDFRKPEAPVLIWEGSRVSVSYEGAAASVRFGKVEGQVYFDAVVDGKPSVIHPAEGGGPQSIALPAAGAGSHVLTLVKRTEASAGTAAFLGVEVPDSAGYRSAGERPARMRMLFIGDSITAGACDEDGDKDQWDDRSTHNASKSWAALTADTFSADYENNSVSGIGVADGWDNIIEAEVWDRLYPAADSPRASLSAFVPDVVFVLLGENDDSYPRAHSLAFPPTYGAAHKSLVHAVRASWPSAHVVLLRGGMWGGKNSPELAKAWDDAVADLEAADTQVGHFVFNHWSSNHPRLDDHRALAGEIVAWLRLQPFMKADEAEPR